MIGAAGPTPDASVAGDNNATRDSDHFRVHINRYVDRDERGESFHRLNLKHRMVPCLARAGLVSLSQCVSFLLSFTPLGHASPADKKFAPADCG